MVGDDNPDGAWRARLRRKRAKRRSPAAMVMDHHHEPAQRRLVMKFGGANRFAALRPDADDGGGRACGDWRRPAQPQQETQAYAQAHASAAAHGVDAAAPPRTLYTYRIIVRDGVERSRMWGDCARAPAAEGFLGCCYHCGQPGHSQNYCPLRRCAACGEWGHTDRVCERRAASR